MERRHHQLLCSGLSAMLRDAKFADFEIVTGDGTSLPCHRIILAAVSPFFETMLETEMKETQSHRVNLPFDSETVQDLLAYIYKGEDILKVDNVAYIYEASNYLTIASLIKDCEEFLKADLPERVSLEIWQTAKRFDKADLVEISKSKVLQGFTVLCNTECMSILCAQNLKELLQDSFLNCTGRTKSRAVWLWVTSHDTTTGEVKELITALSLAKDVECDDILSACANEDGDKLEKTGNDLERAQEMWTNACDRLWIKPGSLNPTRSSIVPYGNADNHDDLVFLDEGRTGKTRLTFFNYREKKWFKMEDVTSLDLGYGYAACSDGSLLYLSGGNTTQYKNQRRLVRFDCGTKECTTLANMPLGREGHAMCRVGRYIYVLGGLSDDDPKVVSVHKYSLADNRWTECGQIAWFAHSSCATAGSVIYLLGGCLSASDRAPTDTAQYYDTTTNISAYLDVRIPIKCKASTAAMTVVNDNIYFLHRADVYRVNPKSGVEKICSIPKAPHKGCSFVSFGTKILVIGGEDDNFRSVRAITQFDCETKIAVTLPMKTPWPMQDFTCVKLHAPASWALDEIVFIR